MTRMTAAQAAVLVMEKEGVTQAFGVPGAAINPLYAALRKRGTIAPRPGAPRRGRLAHGRGLHARQGRQHRRVHRHLRPGRHRHDHRAVFGLRPIRSRSCASPARRRAPGCYKEDFQAVDIESIAKPVTKWAVTVREPAQVPRVVPAGLPPDALGPARARC